MVLGCFVARLSYNYRLKSADEYWKRRRRKPKEPAHILGGLLTFESDWSPALGDSLLNALAKASVQNRLDIGCVAAHGIFSLNEKGAYMVTPECKPATSFLFELIARLQSVATVPMMDIRAYAKWLEAVAVPV